MTTLREASTSNEFLGDFGAFRETNINLIHWLYNRVRRMSHLEDEDLRQVIEFGFWKAYRTYQPHYQFSSYATRVVTNEVLINERPWKRRRKIESGLSLDALVPHDITKSVTFLDMIEADDFDFLLVELIDTINDLTQRERKILQCMYWGMEQRDIGKEVSLSQSQVSRETRKILQKLAG